MTENSFKIYPYRWVVLAVFSGINLTIQIMWICFAAVSGPAAEFYHVTDDDIGLLAMIFMVVYVPMSIPASWIIDRFGIRKGVGLGAVLLGVFGVLRGVCAFDYRLVLGCTVGIALAQPLLMNAVTTVSAKWFPAGERGTASGLAMAGNFVGTAVGLMLTPVLIAKFDIPATQMIYGVITAVSALAFILLARDRPPTPPGPPGSDERSLMFDGIKDVLKKRDVWLGMALFFTGMGVFNGVATWIENIVRPKGFSPQQAGVMGGLLIVGGILGAFVIPTLSDHYRRRKIFMLIGMALATPGLIGFTYATTYAGLLVSIFALGFFMMGLAPVGYQYAAEITYPAPEGTSNGLMMLAGQISVVFIFGMEYMNNRYGSFTSSLLLGAGLMAANCGLIALLRESKLIREGRSDPG